MRKKLRLPMWGAALVLLAGALLFTAAALLIQPGSISVRLHSFAAQPLLLVLNLLPALLGSLFLWCLCGNPFFAAAGAGLIVDLLSYVNLIKTGCRNDPLVPADLSLLREALTATQDYALDLHPKLLAGIVLLAAAVGVLGFFFRCSKPRWPFRAAGAAAVCLAGVLAMSGLYTNDALYARLAPGVDKANVPLTYESCGFPYCFLANFGRYTVKKPADYFPEEAERLAQSDEKTYTAPQVQPNVVFVMCEAFSDLSDEPVFSWTPEDDPLYGFRQVADSDRAVSGHLIVNNFGAGTANTEFDVMTGIATEQLGVNSAFRAVRRNLNSLPRAFARAGYEAYFLHPGYRWYYNRESVYGYLGIEDCVFADAFSVGDYKGPTVSDAAFLDRLISDLGTRLSGDAPVFAFGVTIQNHQSYTYTKYGEVPPVPTNAVLTAQEEEALSVYLQGVRDSSAMLLRLTEYLDRLDEPVLLVFWGDHRPALLENYGVYRALGLSMDGLEAYQTPYLLWANRTYAASCDFSALELAETINANYLGAAVYELAGLSGLDPYFDELEDVRRALPVAAHGVYLTADGTALTPAQNRLLERMAQWAYYRIKDEKLIK